MTADPGFYAILFLGVVAIGILIYFFKKPLRFLWKLLVNTFLGGLLLILCNTLGFPMGVNVTTALVVGILGVPGLLGLYILKWMLG